MKLEKAISCLSKNLSADKTPGSYYHTWQSNIAMSIMDNTMYVTHEEANNAAKAFLELLIK